MKPEPLKIVILGLSVTSSWGNGHATTYRGLMRELTRRKHHVLFLERDVEWYASNRDLPIPPYGRTELYSSLRDLKNRFAGDVRDADVVIVGSYVQEGIEIGEWVTRIADGATAFYDIDTPVTLAKIESGRIDYLSRELVPRYDLYLSFTGGPILECLERRYGSPMARPLYCSVDPEIYFPEPAPRKWELGYIGTYSEDRQPVLERLLLEPARQCREGKFIVAGPMYPKSVKWPKNVRRVIHLAPAQHRAFYNTQRFTLNITRAPMVEAGYSPSVRLFEAAACGTAIISDHWAGLETILEPECEILLVRSAEDTLRHLREVPEEECRRIGERARKKVLARHTASHRALELEHYAFEVLGKRIATAAC